jgi:hypothetical protein
VGLFEKKEPEDGFAMLAIVSLIQLLLLVFLLLLLFLLLLRRLMLWELRCPIMRDDRSFLLFLKFLQKLLPKFHQRHIGFAIFLHHLGNGYDKPKVSD